MLNLSIIQGNLTDYPSLQTAKSGKKYLKFTVACNQGYGANQKTDFINCVAFETTAEFILIPQNSKRRSESKEGMNPSITTSKSKAEFTSVNSEMTCDQHKIIDYGTNPAAFNSAVTDRHIILLH